MPINSVLICRVSGLTFTPTNGEFYLRATCTGYPESKRIEFEAVEMSSNLSGTYKARYSAPAGTQWTGWKTALTNADFENTSITNNYGLAINLFTFGNQNLKAIKITGYINKALTAGTEYTIATNTALKSRVNWYHNIFSGGKGSELLVYISIGTDGNIKITPKTAIASGAAINIAEFYV